MSFVRKSISLRAGVGNEITPAKILDNYYGFNKLLELKQGGMGDSLWDAVENKVLLGNKFGKTGGITGIGTMDIFNIGQSALRTSASTVWLTVKSYTILADTSKFIASLSAWAEGINQSARITYDGVEKALSTNVSTNYPTVLQWTGDVIEDKIVLWEIKGGGSTLEVFGVADGWELKA